MNYVPVVEFVRDDAKVVTDELNEFLMKIKIENEMNGAFHDTKETQSTDLDLSQELGHETDIISNFVTLCRDM